MKVQDAYDDTGVSRHTQHAARRRCL